MDFHFNIVKKFLLTTKSDALLLISLVNREWYTNTWSDFGLIIITKKQAHVFVDSRDIDNLRLHGNKNAKFHKYVDYETFANFLKSLKINSLLIESDKLTIDEMNRYVKPLGIKKINSFKSDYLRETKSPHEIKLLQKAADIVCAGINHLKRWVKIGMTEKQVATELLRFMVNHGATSESFPTIVSFGANAANPHSTPTDRKLKKHEFILVDAGCVYGGYCSDITRVWWIGTPTLYMLKMYNTTLQANLLGIKHVRSGITGQCIDNLCRNYIRDKFDGYDIPHGVGHGVGRLIHEEPRNNQTNTKPLPSGAVVTIEPSIYVQKIGGVRIEDTVVITKTGCKVLTSKTPK